MTLIEHYANLPFAPYRLTNRYKDAKCICLQFSYWEYVCKTLTYWFVKPPPNLLCPLKNNKCMTPLSMDVRVLHGTIIININTFCSNSFALTVSTWKSSWKTLLNVGTWIWKFVSIQTQKHPVIFIPIYLKRCSGLCFVQASRVSH